MSPEVRCCPSSLYTFPAERVRPGLARDYHVTGFPEFGQFCIARFRASTQVFLKSAASAIPPRPLSDDGWACGAYGGRGSFAKMGQGAPSRAGEGIDRDAGIGPPLSCERVRGGAGGPAPLLRWWREPFSEKPKAPRTFKSVASASSAIPAYR